MDKPTKACLKISFIAFYFLLISIAAFSQKNNSTIKGNIKLYKNSRDSADAFCLYYIDLLSGKKTVIPIMRDSAGNFSLSLNADHNQQISLGTAFYKNGSLEYNTGLELLSFFVEPGKTVDLDLDYNQGSRVFKFQGDNAAGNNDYIQFFEAFNNEKISERIYENPLQWRGKYPALKEMMLKKLTEQLKFWSGYFTASTASAFARQQTMLDLKYRALNDVIVLVYSDKVTDSMVVDFSMAINIPLNNPEALGNEEYNKFLLSYYTMLKNNMLKVNPDFTGLEQFVRKYYPQINAADLELVTKIADPRSLVNNDELLKARQYMVDYSEYLALTAELDYFLKLQDPALRDLYTSISLYRRFKDRGIEFIEPQLKRYEHAVKDEKLKKKVLSVYEKQMKVLHKAALSHKSVIHSSEQLQGPELFKTMIEKYKGKVIYLDLWATWCAPCIAEMDNSKKLREKFNSDKVVFLYVCINSSNTKTWKDIIALKIMKGENYFLDINQSKVVSEQFRVSSIPRYILIDKKGKVVLGNAPSPSQTTVVAEIEKLIRL